MIEFVGISKSYTQGGELTHMLNNITHQFEGFNCIVGESGSGKSTLLSIAGLLERSDSGEVKVNGKSCTPEDRAVRARQTGFVFQKHKLISDLNVIDNVIVPCLVNRIPNARKLALESLDALGVVNMAYEYPNALSGGQQQRVAVARAIIHNPELVIADEPTASLDAKNAKSVIEYIFEVCKGRNIILATHNPEVYNAISKRFLLKDGALIPC